MARWILKMRFWSTRYMKKPVGFVTADRDLSEDEQIEIIVNEMMKLLEESEVFDESENKEVQKYDVI